MSTLQPPHVEPLHPLEVVIGRIGLSKLARALGITHQAIRKWEDAGRMPRTEWTGETTYAETMVSLVDGAVTKEQLLGKWPKRPDSSSLRDGEASGPCVSGSTDVLEPNLDAQVAGRSPLVDDHRDAPGAGAAEVDHLPLPGQRCVRREEVGRAPALGEVDGLIRGHAKVHLDPRLHGGGVVVSGVEHGSIPSGKDHDIGTCAEAAPNERAVAAADRQLVLPMERRSECERRQAERRSREDRRRAAAGGKPSNFRERGGR